MHKTIIMFQQGSRPKSESSGTFKAEAAAAFSVFDSLAVEFALAAAAAAFAASLIAFSLGFSRTNGSY